MCERDFFVTNETPRRCQGSHDSSLTETSNLLQGMATMRWPGACSLGILLALGAVGCRSCEPVETALRARENDVRDLRDALHRYEAYNQALQLEIRAIRGESFIPGETPPVAIYPIRSLTLGRTTGGHASDTLAGDDALQVVLEPRDPENQPFKVPASVVICASDITASGLKNPIGTWEISADELSKTWRATLFSTGYVVILPWKIWPSSDKLRVTATLRMTDGRTFEADKDVTIHLPPAAQRPLIQAPVEKPAPPMPQIPAGSALPPPTRLPIDGPVLPMPEKDKQAAASIGTPKPYVVPAAEILRPVPNN